MVGLPRRNASAVPGLKRSRWTQFKAAASRRLGWLWQPRLYAGVGLGFMLGRALPGSGLAPFGVAFYAAVRGAGFRGPEAIPAALAVLAGVWFAAPERFAWVALSILVIHLLAPLLRVGRSGPTPLSAGLLAALAVAGPAVALHTTLGGKVDFVMLAFWIGFTGVVGLVFTMGMSDTLSGRLRMLVPGESAIPAVILLAAAVCGLYGLEPVRGWLSLVDVAAGLMVLSCAYAGGPPVGAAAGGVLGIILLFATFGEGKFNDMPPHLMVQGMSYVVAGLLGGTFRELRKFGTSLAFGLGLVTYVFIAPLNSDTQTIMAMSAGAAILLFWLTPGTWLASLPATFATPPAHSGADAAPRGLEPAVVTERITGMSRVFKEIGRTLEQVAAVSVPEAQRVEPPFQQVTARVCTGCSMYHHCWEREFDTTNSIFDQLWARVEQEGPLNANALPDQLEEICIKPEQIVGEFNYLHETHRTHAYFERKIEEGRAVVVDYLKNVARMMDRFVDEVEHSPEHPRLESTPVLRVQSGVARLPKKGGHISGDSYAGEPLGADRYLLALSDGMGVGRVAAAESKQCIALLREILKAGFATDVAVKTVNSALLLHSPEETFATVDLALLDLATGRSEFVKVGAAPSFIKRGQDVTMVKAASVPVGIINQVQVEPEFRILRAGDLVVMITDGVWDVSKDDVDKERWILEHLRRESSTDPEKVAESLLAQTLELMPETSDDLTVLAARIEAADGAHPTPERRSTGQWAAVRRAPRLSPKSDENPD
ncbi:MAG TPA: SpoIIE family protein phosphatase [Symbiobacteriaceae bacterium]|nr:SpoIIE family protein phosphatase [Symbiobacteriaceae bacterium]